MLDAYAYLGVYGREAKRERFVSPTKEEDANVQIFWPQEVLKILDCSVGNFH